MRVSFGTTSELGPMVKPKGNQIESEEEDDDLNEENSQKHEIIRQLKKDLEEAFKREEALRDRMTLQETFSNKNIQELKVQLKKLQSDGLKTAKIRDGTPTISVARTERKRDGKSKDVREMQKTISNLKAENEVLEEKHRKLTDFVKIAGDMRTQAKNECSYKDGIIQDLKGELRVVENMYDGESRRRVQVEGELHSLRTYVDYLSQKSKEKMKNTICQTETSIPPKFIISSRGTGSTVGFSSNNTSSFANLTAAAASWRLKHVEKEYQQATHNSKIKFDEATRNRVPVRPKPQAQRNRSLSEYSRPQTKAPETDLFPKTFPIERKVREERPSTRSSYASSKCDSYRKQSVPNSASSSSASSPFMVKTRFVFS